MGCLTIGLIDLGIEMIKRYIGNVLLRVEVPNSYEGLFITDYAHNL